MYLCVYACAFISKTNPGVECESLCLDLMLSQPPEKASRNAMANLPFPIYLYSSEMETNPTPSRVVAPHQPCNAGLTARAAAAGMG